MPIHHIFKKHEYSTKSTNFDHFSLPNNSKCTLKYDLNCFVIFFFCCKNDDDSFFHGKKSDGITENCILNCSTTRKNLLIL